MNIPKAKKIIEDKRTGWETDDDDNFDEDMAMVSVLIGCINEHMRPILLSSAENLLSAVGPVANIVKIFRPQS